MERRVVLKRLDDHCLLDGELHPSIRQRLERVQQLPMTALANLHGVERRGADVALVWEFIDGRPLEDVEDRSLFERDVRHVIEALHAHGIVHGALHERNVIIDDRGGVHLTHVSPLLYGDPRIDLAAVDRIFSLCRGEACLRPDGAVSEASEEGEAKLRPYETVDAIRSRALIGAAAAAIVGVIVAGSIIYLVSQ